MGGRDTKTTGEGNSMKTTLPLVISALIAALFVSVTTAHAHPFHACLAEMDWNPKSSRYEVAIKTDPGDMETAIKRHSKNKDFRLKETEAAGKAVFAYLKTRFSVQDATKESDGEKPAAEKRIALKWIGMEVTAKACWLYVEIPVAGGVRDIDLTNKILLDVNPKQINLINATFQKRKQSLHFTRAKPTATLAW